jgi:hypothetical protein
MATLKELLADKTTSSTIDFRNNDKVSDDGVLWSFAWVEDREKKLICIAASENTLKELNKNPEMDNLILSKSEQRITPSKQSYSLYQLNIINTFDISHSNNNVKTQQDLNNSTFEQTINNLLSENLELKNIIKNLIQTSRHKDISDFISKNLIYENNNSGFNTRKEWFDNLDKKSRNNLGLYNVKHYNELLILLNDKTELSIKSIDNLEPLKFLTKLKLLKLSELHGFDEYGNSHYSLNYCAPIDISPLSYLLNLEVLELSSFTVNDITPLKYLYNLKNLKCLFLLSRDSGGYSSFSNFESLKENTQLEKLEIINCDLRKIPILFNYDNIIKLNLSVNKITDISVLRNFKNLEYLNLSYNNCIKDFSPLNCLNKLIKLDLSKTKINDVVNIANSISLEILDLSENEITDLTPISNLINLKKLSIRKMVGKIELAPIAGLKNLMELILDDNKTFDVDVLCKMSHLKKLNLLNCDLTLEDENKLKSSLIDCDIQFRIVYPFY